MKPGTLLDETSAAAVDFDFLAAAVAPASDYGARIFAELAPFAPGDEAAARARSEQIVAVAGALDAGRLDALREIFRNVPDASFAIARASMGDTLDDAGFLELQRFFDACARSDALLEPVGLPPCADDAVRACAHALETGRSGKFGFYLADGFDARLATLRSEFERAQAEYDAARGRALARLSVTLEREIAGDEFIVMRDDLRGPLPSGVRVVREAATYLLCELAGDDAILAALERRDASADAIAAADEDARRALSERIRTVAAQLDEAALRFGARDVLIAAARFTQSNACVVATIVERPVLAFEGGRFIPLAHELEREGRSFSPIAVSLEDVGVLTGPNMGGKSVCLRTCAFIATCAAFGLPVPARAATCALFDDIAWLGVGNEAEPGGLLSSFARASGRLRNVVARDRKRRFVALDEFARTTTPREGRALLVAVIERFRALGVVAMAATHLAGVAEAAGVRHFAVRGLRGIPQPPRTPDLSDALVTLAASMDYTIEEVTGAMERSSDALALASLLGLDDALVAAAYGELRKE